MHENDCKFLWILIASGDETKTKEAMWTKERVRNNEIWKSGVKYDVVFKIERECCLDILNEGEGWQNKKTSKTCILKIKQDKLWSTAICM